MINNAVYSDRTRGEIIGYRCSECYGIFQKMWGEVCNNCRGKERRHQELLAAIDPPPTTWREEPPAGKGGEENES